MSDLDLPMVRPSRMPLTDSDSCWVSVAVSTSRWASRRSLASFFSVCALISASVRARDWLSCSSATCSRLVAMLVSLEIRASACSMSIL